MDTSDDKHWQKVNEFLAKIGPNLSILEEEVDLKVQQEYFGLARSVESDPEQFQKWREQYAENIDNLFDSSISEETKKQMLVVLATIEDVAVYRNIEKFAKENIPLQKWAVIALQQSRILIQSSLSDDSGIFISTGLGGQGSLLRYFCVFLNQKNEILKEFEQNVLKNEIETAFSSSKGIIEQIEYREGYNTLLALLPLNFELKQLFESIIRECNQYGHFLHENIILTNVRKLPHEEILHYLKTFDAEKAK